MDKIISNILKYADPSFPIEVSNMIYDDYIGIRFCNTIRYSDGKAESYGVGLKRIENMMRILGGRCQSSKIENMFCVDLLFLRVDHD